MVMTGWMNCYTVIYGESPEIQRLFLGVTFHASKLGVYGKTARLLRQSSIFRPNTFFILKRGGVVTWPSWLDNGVSI